MGGDLRGARGEVRMSARYDEALASLLASPTRPKLGLERMRALLRALGDPHERFRALHVAGTKGKGSVCSLAAAMCRAHGLKVGLTTSPHLSCARERIDVAGDMVDEAQFVELSARVGAAARALSEDATFFEKMIAMSFCAFADARVDIAVVEVGLGGRLDATNVLTPRACAITRLGLDHTEFLGPTLTHIAREKAGILKRGVPAFTVPQVPEALIELRRVASAVEAPLEVVSSFSVTPSLVGAHQRENASLAAALVRAGANVSDAAIEEGARSAWLPGRYEVLRTAPLVIADGAHNAEAARALREALRAATRVQGRGVALVVGMTSGHDPDAFARALGPLPLRRIIAAPLRTPRGLPPRRVASAFGAEEAHSLALALQRASDGPAVVTGSLYLVGEARGLLLGAPADPAFPLF